MFCIVKYMAFDYDENINEKDKNKMLRFIERSYFQWHVFTGRKVKLYNSVLGVKVTDEVVDKSARFKVGVFIELQMIAGQTRVNKK